MGGMAQAQVKAGHDRSLQLSPDAPTLRRRPTTSSAFGNQAHLRRLSVGDQPLQAKLTVGAIDDPLEHEADAVADRVMRMADPAVSLSSAPTLSRKCAACEEEDHAVQRKADGVAMGGEAAPEIVSNVLGASGHALDPATHDFMASRFGTDFSDVRIHTDTQAAASAAAVGARAYTVGRDVVFGAGAYDPAGEGGRRLLAHELAHVVQQGGGGATGTVRRAQLQILPADFVGPLNADQRRAAASCNIGCSGASIGTLHAMPLYFHTSRSPTSGSATSANGVGASLHFVRTSAALGSSSDCASCTDYKMIQIINSNVPSDSRNRQDFVDNNSSATPFYDDTYAGGTGLHTIPNIGPTPDVGSQVDTTRSIYDTPYRSDGSLTSLRPVTYGGITLLAGQDFWWNAETCVTCVKPGADKVLGNCITYGFRRAWNAAANRHDAATGVGPACNSGPSAAFVRTLRTDSSTSSYDFTT